ncbi:MAG: hypothetical protein IJ012_07215 [Clostridia bacterium]|nr:hypothetical protein [Clostridia bacterium]
MKFLRMTALLLSLAVLCAALAACGGGLNGTYSNIEGELEEGLGDIYEFSGSRFTYRKCALGEDISSFSGNYSIKDGQLTIRSSEAFIGGVLDMQSGKYIRTFTFEEGDGFIKLNDTVFYKK